MANVATLFVDPAGTYVGGYTSRELESNSSNYNYNATRAIIHVELTSGIVTLEMRVAHEAVWIPVRVYNASMLEEIVIANFLRVVVSDSAKIWLGETK